MQDQNKSPLQQSLDNLYKKKAKLKFDYNEGRINQNEYEQLISGNKTHMNNVLSQHNSMYPEGAPGQLKHNYEEYNNTGVSPDSQLMWQGSARNGYRRVRYPAGVRYPTGKSIYNKNQEPTVQTPQFNF